MKVLNKLARVSGQKIVLLKTPKLYKNILLATITIFVGFIVGLKTISTEVFAQSDEKSISLGPHSFLKPQISIKEAKVGEIKRKFDDKFSAGSKWLRETSFRIENVSGKQIVYLRINVWFPETAVSGPIMVYPVTFGRHPNSKETNANPFVFQQREILDVSLEPKFSEISRFIGERHSVETINQIRLEVSFIVFDDETAWSVGTFMVRDPNNPGRFIPSDPRQ